MKPNKQQAVEEFLVQADLSTTSVKWLEEKVEKIINKIDKLNKIEETTGKFYPEKRNKLEAELENLLSRVKLEINTIDKLEKQMIKFIVDEKNQKKKIKRRK